MAIKQARYVLIFFFLIVLAPVLQAQTSWFLDPDSDETRFIQRLAWRGGEYALRYEVIIEREANGTWRSHLREFTTALFIEVSLAPGGYRFRVIPYDVLNKPGEGSRWMPVVVRLALQPELYDFAQDFVYDDNDPVLILNIDGNNLVPGAEIFLLDNEGTRFSPDQIDSGGEKNIRLFFARSLPESGDYEIIVRNPGGLEAKRGIFISFPEEEPELEVVPEPEIVSEPEVVPEPEVISEPEAEPESENKPESGEEEQDIPVPEKLFFVNSYIVWNPVLPLYGDLFNEGASSVSLGLNVIFKTPMRAYIGPEFTVTAYSFGIGMIAVGGNLLMQKRLADDKAGFNFRLGVSCIPPLDADINININMGSAFFVNIKYLYLEAGMEYIHSAGSLFPDNVLGSFRPCLGIGLQF